MITDLLGFIYPFIQNFLFSQEVYYILLFPHLKIEKCWMEEKSGHERRTML